MKSFLFTGVQDDLSFIYTARVLFPRVSNRVLIKKSSTVEETFVKTIASAIFMIALWLLLSGIYKPMLVGFGVASVILVLFIVRRIPIPSIDKSICPFVYQGLAWDHVMSLSLH